MSSRSPDTPPSAQAALEADLRQAVLDGDMARVGALAFSAPLDDDFRFELIGGVIAAADDAPLVTRLIDSADGGVTPTAFVNYLAKAAAQGHAQTALYMQEQCIEAGIAASECRERILKNAPADKLVPLVSAMDRAAPGKNIAAEMMLYAAMHDRHDSLAALVKTGASTAGHGGMIIMMLLEDRKTHFAEPEKKQEYLSLLSSVMQLSAGEPGKGLTLSSTLIAYLLPDGREYPEALDAAMKAGADPFAMKEEAVRFLVKKFNESDDTARADMWRARFDTWQQAYTDKNRHAFDTLFGETFRAQDLLQSAGDHGETGLQLAVKARRIPEVMRALARDPAVGIDHLFAETPSCESPLSLAIDRGDAAALLAPEYWRGRGVDIVAELQSRLSDDRKKWIDMDSIVAQDDTYHLQSMAEDFQPSFRLRRRAR